MGVLKPITSEEMFLLYRNTGIPAGSSLSHVCVLCEQELGSSTWIEMLFEVMVRIVFKWEQ